MPSPREELLARIVDEVGRHGLHDRSLRDLASAVGTSHRMLLYHFGSREGLVTAIVAAVEAAERELMRELVSDAEGPLDLVRAHWTRLSAPEMHTFIRLFFEAASYPSSTQERTTPWIDEAEDVGRRLGVRFDPVDVRLGVAVIRGLLLDVLSGTDVAAATASLERFLTMWEAQRAPSRGGRPASVHSTPPR
jgi:AcrR family transcriptional regulator